MTLFTVKFWWNIFLKVGLPMGILCVLFSVVYAKYYLPSVEEANSFIFSEASIIYDREALSEGENPDDHILYTMHGGENRQYMPLSQISQHMIDATLAIEDDQFYSHFGVDIPATIKAVLSMAGFGPPRGGSTITQQLMKNVFLDNRRQLIRKYKEALLAIKTERAYTKDQILELYLNKIFLGSNAYGVEAASQTYFGHPASELTILESSILASLIKLPAGLNPNGPNVDKLMGYYDEGEDGNMRYVKGRKDLVLQRMVTLGMITSEQATAARMEGETIEFQRNVGKIKAPHFVFLVQQQLAEKYGEDILDAGGLRIYTTLDGDLQTLAEEEIQKRMEYYPSDYKATNAALAAINPENGEILAYVGGNYFDDENDGKTDVLQSKRQPGSSFKPLVYATAFEAGLMGAGSVLWDVEMDFGNGYTPQNFSGDFQGPVSVRKSLNESLNIPAIKTAALAGPEKVLETAEKLGIAYAGDADQYGVAIGVGVAEVDILSHINSFSAFAGDGSWSTPSSILEVRNNEDQILDTFDSTANRQEGIDAEVAALVREVMTDEDSRPVTDGFAWNKLLQLGEYDNGAKTGTSNKLVPNPDFNANLPVNDDTNPVDIRAPGDSWTVGFTPHLVAGVWVGNNDGSPMKPGATGLTVAAPIWHSFMEDAHETLEEKGIDKEKQYNTPTDLTSVYVNIYNGFRTTDETPESMRGSDYFVSFGVPNQWDNLEYEEIEIDTVLLAEANEFTPEWAKGTAKRPVFTSERPRDGAWEGPVQQWLLENGDALTDWGMSVDDVAYRREMNEEQTLALYAELMDEWKAIHEPEPEEVIVEEVIRSVPVPILDPSRYGKNRNTKKVNEMTSRPDTALLLQQRDASVTFRTPTESEKVEDEFSASVAITGVRSVRTVEFRLNGRSAKVLSRPPWTADIVLNNQDKKKNLQLLETRVTSSNGEVLVDNITLQRKNNVTTKAPVINENMQRILDFYE